MHPDGSTRPARCTQAQRFTGPHSRSLGNTQSTWTADCLLHICGIMPPRLGISEWLILNQLKLTIRQQTQAHH